LDRREKELVAFDRVGKMYNNGTVALHSFNLQIRKGEFVTFLGPSGCGKSTALRMAAGLSEPTDGEVTVFGQSPKQTIKETTNVAFVFQEPTLLPWRKVIDNVVLPLELKGVSKKEARSEAQRVLEMVGLTEHLYSYPRQLSGGMQMRVSIARALAAKPKLLLMDEPFAALDEITRQKLQVELLEIWKKEAATILFVTHNVFEAVFLSTKIAVLSSSPGRLTEVIDVNLPSPRRLEDRTSEVYNDYVEQASKALEEGSNKQKEGA
jgi:NitT/TauT family transport system ATP-binding protein